MIILGSTGSIGAQALDVARRLECSVVALTANRDAKALEAQIREFRPQAAALADEAAARELKRAVADLPTRILSGPEGLRECAAMEADCALNSITGIAGLPSAIAALEAKTPLALANKESLVAGGALVTRLATEGRVPILPVDSEHSAIFQALQGLPPSPEGGPDISALRRIILTASGGSFYGKSRGELAGVTLAEALRHPSWRMGAKITVDSATMMNKGLEIIEAAWLFGLPQERIDVVVHRQSVVHSLIEYRDGSVLAQLGVPDMRSPIQYAITYPARLPSPVKRLQLAEWGSLSFEAPDEESFPAMRLARGALQQGGLAPTVLNAANEAANALFRAGKIRFLRITELVASALEGVKPTGDEHSLADIFAADQAAREYVQKIFKN